MGAGIFVPLQKLPAGQGNGLTAALRRYGQKLPAEQGRHAASRAEQDVKRDEAFTYVPAGQLQLMPV